MATHLSFDDLTRRLKAWAAEQTCGCGHLGLNFEWRLRARPVGSFSLAGQQAKASVNREAWIICPSCGASASAS